VATMKSVYTSGGLFGNIVPRGGSELRPRRAADALCRQPQKCRLLTLQRTTMSIIGFSKFTRVLTGIVACAGVPASHVVAQEYPVKPIRIILGYSAGGSTDITARLVAQRLSESLNQQVIVENRPGAGGTLADERVARSPADGYTLLVMAGSATITPALRKVAYDVERDLAPVSLLVSVPYVLVVHPSLPVRDVKGLIALAQSRPGKLSYGSSGIGKRSRAEPHRTRPPPPLCS